jgi:hypothetical protein
MTAMTIRDLTADEYAALCDYAHENGRTWRNKLELDWYNARAIGDRGAILHGLRNDPRWNHQGLYGFRADWPHILTVLPEHVSTVTTTAETGDLKWSGKGPVPAVGAAVERHGGVVVGYVKEGGWLALWVRAGKEYGTVFGAEL